MRRPWPALPVPASLLDHSAGTGRQSRPPLSIRLLPLRSLIWPSERRHPRATLPHLTSPHLTLPLTLPCLTSPYLTSPCLALPHVRSRSRTRFCVKRCVCVERASWALGRSRDWGVCGAAAGETSARTSECCEYFRHVCCKHTAVRVGPRRICRMQNVEPSSTKPRSKKVPV
ncbi:hypothetical protein BJ546DRAFT_994715 [Cryomyces antarcticus]